jgi:hypothetical protein
MQKSRNHASLFRWWARGNILVGVIAMACASWNCEKPAIHHMRDTQGNQVYLIEQGIEALLDPRPGSEQLRICADCRAAAVGCRERKNPRYPICAIHFEDPPPRPVVRTHFSGKPLHWIRADRPSSPYFLFGTGIKDSIGSAVNTLRVRCALHMVRSCPGFGISSR